MEKPPQNLSTDEQGNTLTDGKAVAARWFTFLKKKFSATEAEVNERPPMPVLPQAAEPGDELTDEEVLRAISKLQ